MTTFKIDPVWLRQRYVVDRAPVSVIATEAGVNPSTVHHALHRAEIPLRGKAGARAVQTLDRAWLAARLAEQMPLTEIASVSGMGHSSVVWQMAEYGLYRVPDGQHQRAALAAERYRQGRSLADISVTLGVDRKTVTLWLAALGVPIRRPGRRPRPQ